jgi:hypothetical protein
MSSKRKSSATFTLFPKLPIEIRLKIWKTICYTQRNVDITTGHFSVSEDEKSTKVCLFFYRSSCPAPAVLHVSRESRSEGLKHYELDFAVNHEVYYRRTSPFFVIMPPQIYFNWKVDKLCIVNPSLLEVVNCRRTVEENAEHLGLLCNRKKLQYMAYNCKEFMDHWRVFTEVIDRAVCLREIALFDVAFPEKKGWFSLRFNKHICPQGDCRCVSMKWWMKTHAVEGLWKRQEKKSIEKASLRFGHLTWTSKGRTGSVDS